MDTEVNNQMPDRDDDILKDLDKSFNMLRTDPVSEAAYETQKQKDLEWKLNDPAGYKKDMEKMCKEMFGDKWEVEYKAMLAEEFPEETN